MGWTSRDGREFALILLALGELFDTPVSETRAELFTRALEDLPFEQVKVAAADYTRTGLFFPKPAELRERVLGNAEDRAELAWQFVLREVRRVGYTGTPSWPDEATERAALGLFGGTWRTLCSRLPAEGPELLGYRKSFIAAFGAADRQQALGLPTRAEAAATLDALKAQLKLREKKS